MDAGATPPRGHVDQIDAQLAQLGAQPHGVLDRPAAVHPVGGREPHEHGLALGERGAHFLRHGADEPGAPRVVATPGVRAGVRQGRVELVQQVAVRGVHLDGIEARGVRSSGRLHERVDNHLDPRLGEAVGGVLVDHAHRTPPARLGRQDALGVPRPPAVRAGLAPGVAELDSHRRALGVGEVHDRRPRGRLLVVPQAGVERGDAALRGDPGRLRDDEPEAADGEAAIVHRVPRARDAVLGVHRVLAHGRHPGAVAHGQVAQGEGLEEGWLGHRPSLGAALLRREIVLLQSGRSVTQEVAWTSWPSSSPWPWA